MGRNARLRQSGIAGPGVGSGNPIAPELTFRQRGTTRAVRFSDRDYAVDMRTGQFRRLERVQSSPNHHWDHGKNPETA